jgi:hypothetical protein
VTQDQAATDAESLAHDEKIKARHELIAVVLLSITTILTAWSAFESSKWGGAMSISFSQASSARIEASRLDGRADQRTAVHVDLWVQWLDAQGYGQKELAREIADRFPEPLATAHQEWLETDPDSLKDDTATPFEMPSYVIEERTLAQEADARADAKFAEALRNNQRGDNYTLLTVLFASVLFFTAMSGRLNDRRSRWAMLLMGMGLAVVGIVFLISFPKLI